jgi:iron-sulfur cluster assembly accessory protein
MTLPEQTQVQMINLTAPAADAVKELLTKRNLEGHALRVFISGGGCSGFQYGMALDDNIRESDYIVESNGIKLLVDEVSIDYLNGATVDYVEDIMGGGFKIQNPNALSTCGCGQSFRTSEGDAGDAGGGCGSCS